MHYLDVISQMLDELVHAQIKKPNFVMGLSDVVISEGVLVDLHWHAVQSDHRGQCGHSVVVQVVKLHFDVVVKHQHLFGVRQVSAIPSSEMEGWHTGQVTNNLVALWVIYC